MVSLESATGNRLTAGGHGGPPYDPLQNVLLRRVGHRADHEGGIWSGLETSTHHAKRFSSKALNLLNSDLVNVLYPVIAVVAFCHGPKGKTVSLWKGFPVHFIGKENLV